MEACSHTDLMIQVPRWDVGFRRPSLVPGQGPIQAGVEMPAAVIHPLASVLLDVSSMVSARAPV